MAWMGIADAKLESSNGEVLLQLLGKVRRWLSLVFFFFSL